MIEDSNLDGESDRAVICVNGLVPADQLGVVDAHSHVWIEQVPGANLAGLILDDAGAITAELVDYRMAGGGAIVDCQPGGCGRNGPYAAPNFPEQQRAYCGLYRFSFAPLLPR